MHTNDGADEWVRGSTNIKRLMSEYNIQQWAVSQGTGSKNDLL